MYRILPIRTALSLTILVVKVELWIRKGMTLESNYHTHTEYRKHLGPLVQSVVSLTNSLRVISLTVLADSIYNILIIFAEKNVCEVFTITKYTPAYSSQQQSHV